MVALLRTYINIYPIYYLVFQRIKTRYLLSEQTLSMFLPLRFLIDDGDKQSLENGHFLHMPIEQLYDLIL